MKVFYCAVRYEIYTGKLANLKPTGEFAMRPPFKVIDYELKRHLKPCEVTEVMELGIGETYISTTTGDQWTRNS